MSKASLQARWGAKLHSDIVIFCLLMRGKNEKDDEDDVGTIVLFLLPSKWYVWYNMHLASKAATPGPVAV